MTVVVTGETVLECINKASLLQRFGWAIQKPIYFEGGLWRIVLYLHV